MLLELLSSRGEFILPFWMFSRVVLANGEIGGYAFGSHEKIVVIPNPLALDWSILSEVNRIGLSFLYFKATDSIMQSGLCLSNPLGNNERFASSMWE